MTRRQWIWVGALGVALLYVLGAARYAYESNAFGSTTSGIVRALAWSLAMLALLANAIGVLGAIRESSTALVFRVVNARAGRWTILVGSVAIGTLLWILATRSPAADWSCAVLGSPVRLAPERPRCPDGTFTDMRSFRVRLVRASPATDTPTLRAVSLDRATSSVGLESDRRGFCVGGRPDDPLFGEARIALGSECGAGSYVLNVNLCDVRPSSAALTKAVRFELDSVPLACDDPGDGSGTWAGDAGTDAPPPATCPRWAQRPAAGSAWLYARVETASGIVMAPRTDHVDVFVRAATAAVPGEHADPNDPCAVGSYEQSTAKVRIIAAAIGFVTTEIEATPTTCSQVNPCAVVLPRSLDPQYYASDARVRTQAEVPEAARPAFAAAITADALERSKALHRDLATELESSGAATAIPAPDLAIHYTEATLHRKCDASCLTDQRLDPAMRAYLHGLRRPNRPDPFAPPR